MTATSRLVLTDLDAREARRRLRAVPWAELSRLLDQQLWCWERDRRSEIAVPSAPRVAGAQVLVRDDGVWARFAATGGGTLLLRHRPGPFVAAPDTADDMGAGLLRHPEDEAGARAALADVAGLCRWMAEREQRLLSERGPAYRFTTVQSLHPSRHYCAPGALAGCWRAWASLME